MEKKVALDMFAIEDEEETAFEEAKLQDKREVTGPLKETKDGRLLVPED